MRFQIILEPDFDPEVDPNGEFVRPIRVQVDYVSRRHPRPPNDDPMYDPEVEDTWEVLGDIDPGEFDDEAPETQLTTDDDNGNRNANAPGDESSSNLQPKAEAEVEGAGVQVKTEPMSDDESNDVAKSVKWEEDSSWGGLSVTSNPGEPVEAPPPESSNNARKEEEQKEDHEAKSANLFPYGDFEQMITYDQEQRQQMITDISDQEQQHQQISSTNLFTYEQFQQTIQEDEVQRFLDQISDEAEEKQKQKQERASEEIFSRKVIFSRKARGENGPRNRRRNRRRGRDRVKLSSRISMTTTSDEAEEKQKQKRQRASEENFSRKARGGNGPRNRRRNRRSGRDRVTLASRISIPTIMTRTFPDRQAAD